MSKPFDIGIVTKPHGINGEVKVFPVTDDPDRFYLLDHAIFSSDGKEDRVIQFTGVRRHGNLIYLKLKGIQTRDDASRLIGSVIKIPFDQALPLREREYYHRDLIGMDVIDEERGFLGRIEDILQTGANDVYSVRNNGKVVLIPAVGEFVLDVDVRNQKMTVRLPEGI